MRLRPRPLRPQSNLTILAVVVVIAVCIWAVGELARTHWGRALLGLLSLSVLLLFLIGWSTR